MKLRNFLYDKKFLQIEKLPCPVISIGNVSSGGTGKTPLTIFTAKYLLSKDMTIGIISRGYKRKSKGIVIVSDGHNINDNYNETGDELLMIAQELMKDHQGNFSVAAGENRKEAAKFLFENFQPDILILDDGFQHRSIGRDLDVVLIDGDDYRRNRFENSFLLPSGFLREDYSGLSRADILIQNNKGYAISLINKIKNSEKPHAVIRYDYEYFVDHGNINFENITKDVIIFSGIARSYSFRNMLSMKGYNIVEEIIFDDHHFYSVEDIEKITGAFKENANKNKKAAIVTTQKDFLKLKKFEYFLNEYPVYYPKLKVIFEDNEEIFLKKLNELIALKKNRNSKIEQ